MKAQIQKFRKAIYAAAAFVMFTAAVLPSLGGSADAAQVTTRSIEMSSSAVTATATSYLVTFTAPSVAQSIAFDFCSDTPIIGATCTAPSGFTVASAGLTTGSGVSGWTITGTPTANHIAISGSATTGGATLSFTFTGVTNPTTLGTFYARVYTYASSTPGWASATSLGSDLDYGGFALSTANTIAISATVMETLTFCVSGTAPAAGCTSTSTPSVILGHGTPAVVDSTQVDDNGTVTPTFTQLSTNAQSGAIVRMKNSNACGGLSNNGGTTCAIPPSGVSPTTITNATGGFGLYVANGTGGTGTVTADANYNSGGSSQYTMDTTAVTGVTGTYGDAIEASTAPVSSVNSQLKFAAITAATTAAGVYTATMTLIATGTF